jgi:DNA-binding NarL/FixJ family response regulator
MSNRTRRQSASSTRGNESLRPTERGLYATRFEVDGDEYAILSIPLPSTLPLGDNLTAAEREVLELLLRGSSNAQIAAVRATSARTVANQLAAIYRKLGVTSRAEVAAVGLRAARRSR